MELIFLLLGVFWMFGVWANLKASTTILAKIEEHLSDLKSDVSDLKSEIYSIENRISDYTIEKQYGK